MRGETTTACITGSLIERGLLTIGDGYRAKNSELATSGLPFARAGNIDAGFHFDGVSFFPERDLARVGDKISRPGDVVFTSKGTVGRFAFVRKDTPRFVFAPQLCYWRSLDHAQLDPRWLYYWMHGPEFWQQASSLKGQTDMADYISLTDQRRMTITLPPINAQRGLATVMGALDDKIDLNRRLSRTLERLARAVFRAWFVDFEPVKAKVVGGRSFPGMARDVFDSLPDGFADSELGPVPVGWEVARLGDVASVNERSISRELPLPLMQYVDISSVTEGWLTGTTTVTAADAPGRARRLVRHGDTIWSCVRPNRRSHLFIVRPPADMIVSTGFTVMTPRRVPASYLYCWTTRSEFVDYLTANATGSAYPAVRGDHFEIARILTPPAPLLDAFEVISMPLWERAEAAARESQLLGALRDLLLPKLLSGELRVESAVSAVERTTP